MPRGSKICKRCNGPNGARSFRCKHCGEEFTSTIKLSKYGGVSKAVKKVQSLGKPLSINDIQAGDVIKVVSGSGPIYEDKTDDINMGYHGIFFVKHKDKSGLLSYPLSKNGESGACYIYMGEEKVSNNGTIMLPHKIVSVDEKLKVRLLERIGR